MRRRRQGRLHVRKEILKSLPFSVHLKDFMRQRPTPCVSQADLTLAEARSGASRGRRSRLAHPFWARRRRRHLRRPSLHLPWLRSLDIRPKSSLAALATWRLERGAHAAGAKPGNGAPHDRPGDPGTFAGAGHRAQPLQRRGVETQEPMLPPCSLLRSVVSFGVEVVLRPSLAVSTTVATTPLPVSAAPVTSLPEHRPGRRETLEGLHRLGAGPRPLWPLQQRQPASAA